MVLALKGLRTISSMPAAEPGAGTQRATRAAQPDSRHRPDVIMTPRAPVWERRARLIVSPGDGSVLTARTDGETVIPSSRGGVRRGGGLNPVRGVVLGPGHTESNRSDGTCSREALTLQRMIQDPQ